MNFRSREVSIGIAAVYTIGLGLGLSMVGRGSTSILSEAVRPTPMVRPESDASKVTRLGWNRALTQEGEKIEERLVELGLSPTWHSLVPFEKLQESLRLSLRLPNRGYLVFTEGDKEPTVGFVWVDDRKEPHFTVAPRRLVNSLPVSEEENSSTPEAKLRLDLSKFIDWRGEQRPNDSHDPHFIPGIELRFHRTEYNNLVSYLETPDALAEVQIRGLQGQLAPSY